MKEKDKTLNYFAVKHKDWDVRANSRSGGIFTAISDYLLELNGVVYGARLTDNFTAEHFRAETKNKRNLLRGSKYVQSKLCDTFLSVENDLSSNRLVLFSGTPCQVAGLLRFLEIKKIDTQNLYTLDIVCHGVPTEKVWIDYLGWIQKTHSKKIVKVDFRNKVNYGWGDHVESVWFEDGTRFDGKYFKYLFYRHYIIRPSCFECRFKGNYLSDFTIGDCWGIQRSHPEFNDDKGISLLILHNEKAEKLFDKIKGELEVLEVKPEEVYQKPLFQPEECPVDRDKFWKVYNKKPFKTVVNKFAIDGFSVKFKRKIKSILKRLGVMR